jgi:hypothetical protein
VAPDSGDRTVPGISVDIGAAEGGEADVFDKLAVAEQVSESVGTITLEYGVSSSSIWKLLRIPPEVAV